MNADELEKLADEVEAILTPLAPADYHAVLTMVGYRRPWRPKHTGWTNVLDQVLHTVYAIIIFFPLVIWPSYWTAALSGLFLGAIREWEQWKNWDFKILMLGDRIQDASFFGVGGVIIYYLSNII